MGHDSQFLLQFLSFNCIYTKAFNNLLRLKSPIYFCPLCVLPIHFFSVFIFLPPCGYSNIFRISFYFLIGFSVVILSVNYTYNLLSGVTTLSEYRNFISFYITSVSFLILEYNCLKCFYIYLKLHYMVLKFYFNCQP